MEDAERLASHFAHRGRRARPRHLGPAAAELLATLFLAVKLAGIDLAGAYAWLQSELDPTAAVLLEQGGYTACSVKTAVAVPPRWSPP